MRSISLPFLWIQKRINWWRHLFFPYRVCSINYCLPIFWLHLEWGQSWEPWSSAVLNFSSVWLWLGSLQPALPEPVPQHHPEDNSLREALSQIMEKTTGMAASAPCSFITLSQWGLYAQFRSYDLTPCPRPCNMHLQLHKIKGPLQQMVKNSE